MQPTRVPVVTAAAVLMFTLVADTSLADGKVVRPRNYNGSLEEKAQEAIIIFTEGDDEKSAVEQLILKIQVAGEVDNFAWVVPLPSKPKVEEADAKLFRELFDYVQMMKVGRYKGESAGAVKDGPKVAADNKDVEVLSREIVGSFDVAVVKEIKAGTLNTWLTDNGYQALEDSDDVVGFYREKGYVFACVRVSDVARADADAEANAAQPFDLHPLSFTFETGGRDGIFFPMRMTGLQSEPFDVNLYVFYRFWLNDRINEFGYTHRDFHLTHRDWDTRECTANGGKSWDAPANDPLLRRAADEIPTVAKFFKENYAGRRFYLTNIAARQLKPKDVRAWKDDLWLFPYYTNPKHVPDDVRGNGPASAAWKGKFSAAPGDGGDGSQALGAWIAVAVGVIVIGALAAVALRRRA